MYHKYSTAHYTLANQHKKRTVKAITNRACCYKEDEKAA